MTVRRVLKERVACSVASVRRFVETHPSLRQALLWSLPALIIGLTVRVILCSYFPIVCLRPDSSSYLSFATRLILEGDISLDEKRRYVYPILLLPALLLPGKAISTIMWLQHLAGLSTVIPLAYVCRATMQYWKWFLPPATTVWAAFPIAVWCEHEVLADTWFTFFFAWAFGGWVAWQKSGFSPRRWWFFFLPFALCVLTKPAGKLLWLVPILAILATGAWRHLRPRYIVAALVVGTLSFVQGSDYMAARHLSMSAFPLIRLDTPKHGDLKLEVRERVQDARAKLHTYHAHDSEPFRFLQIGGRNAIGSPRWQEVLKSDEATDIVRSIGREGILHEPHLFAYIVFQRCLAAANPSAFDLDILSRNYVASETVDSLESMTRRQKSSPWISAYLFSEPTSTGAPDPRVLMDSELPHVDPLDERKLQTYTEFFHRHLALLTGSARGDSGNPNPVWKMLPPTALGWLVLIGALVSLCRRTLRYSVGVWTGIAAIYLLGIFSVAAALPRFFYCVWPVFLVLACLCLDAAIAFARGIWNRRACGVPDR